MGLAWWALYGTGWATLGARMSFTSERSGVYTPLGMSIPGDWSTYSFDKG
jgi:hypothetical protein